MNRSSYWFLLLLAALGGFIGGAISSRITETQRVFAQAEPSKIVMAEEFRLLDKAGRKLAEFRVDADGRPRLLMYDRTGKIIWSAPDPMVKRLTAR